MKWLLSFLTSWFFGPIGVALKAIWHWLLEDWRHPPLFFFSLFAVAHYFVIDPNLKQERDKALAALEAEKDAHLQTIANFVQASRLAEERQTGNITRVEGEQAQITERIVHDYETSVAAVRARADALAQRLRSQAQTDPGLPGAAGLPGSGAATGGVADTAGDHRLPASLDLDRWTTCTLQAVQLDALISWNIDQAAVITTPVETVQ